MASFNKVILMGNLTRDIELKYTQSQIAIADVGLAINRKRKSQDGSYQDDTCFVNCVAFDKNAQLLAQYLKKGSPLFIEGRLSFDSWTAQDGTKRSAIKVVIDRFQFIPTQQGQQSAQQQPQVSQQGQQAFFPNTQGQPPTQQAQTPQQSTQAPQRYTPQAPPPAYNGNQQEIRDEDIPF